MIRFHDIPANEEAADALVREMRSMGFKATEARPLVDKAAALAIATLRRLDADIDALSDDDTDRTIIQQIVLMQLVGSSKRAMELNAIQGLFQILFRR